MPEIGLLPFPLTRRAGARRDHWGREYATSGILGERTASSPLHKTMQERGTPRAPCLGHGRCKLIPMEPRGTREERRVTYGGPTRSTTMPPPPPTATGPHNHKAWTANHTTLPSREATNLHVTASRGRQSAPRGLAAACFLEAPTNSLAALQIHEALTGSLAKL